VLKESKVKQLSLPQTDTSKIATIAEIWRYSRENSLIIELRKRATEISLTKKKTFNSKTNLFNK
jgi:hypothetical protein